MRNPLIALNTAKNERVSFTVKTGPRIYEIRDLSGCIDADLLSE
jgi:hypothetical protein